MIKLRKNRDNALTCLRTALRCLEDGQVILAYTNICQALAWLDVTMTKKEKEEMVKSYESREEFYGE